jgi:creatinine amidohydrolase
MRPEEIKDAVIRKLPVMLPVGAVEYHGEHLPIGTDTLIAEGLCKKIEERAEVVVVPALPFSPTMHWAGGAASGDMDFSERALAVYAEEYILQLTAIGFQRIYALIGHQGKEGAPALIMRRAGRIATAKTAASLGDGWSRLKPEQWPVEDLFSIVRVCDYDEFSDYSGLGGRMPVGHGGRGETQLIMALYDGLVKMGALKGMENLPEWLADVYEADKADGRFWVEFCVNGFVRHFGPYARVESQSTSE